MVIFYQWPKLGLGLDVEAEIQILKDIIGKSCLGFQLKMQDKSAF
jgi:hypothetical protein